MGTFIRLDNVVKSFPPGNQHVRSILSTKQVQVRADDKVAVAGVSLSIKQGESIGIVGSNGAGKSTLLHMVAGLSTQSSGSIEVNGKVTAIMTLGIGLSEESSGRENIYIDGEIQGKSRSEIEQFIDQIIEFADIGEFIDQPVRTYSTGMKARLAFAMISHIEPEILIIDEALSAGDASFSRKASARIKEICASGKIVIIVSHAMPAIIEYCNRCLWMKDGHVVLDGSPKEVTSAYIESVRAVDEKLLVEKFRDLTITRSLQAGWAVNDTLIYNGDTPEPTSLLEAGLPTRIFINADIPAEGRDSDIHIRITRLDDLPVFDERFVTETYLLSEGSVGLEIEMTSLMLAPAIYKLHTTLELEDTVCAETSVIFEVYSNNLPAGGRPVLTYPLRASSTSLVSEAPI